jgi:hypothetical protein
MSEQSATAAIPPPPKPGRDRSRVIVGALAIALVVASIAAVLVYHSATKNSSKGSGTTATGLPGPPTSSLTGPGTIPAPYVTSFDGPQYPLVPYISRSFIDSVPKGKGSFVDQPWRGYLETIPANEMLAGIGMNYNPPQGVDHDALIRDLAAVGVRTLRIEVGWSQLTSEETALQPAAMTNYKAIFDACKRYGVVPEIILNANDGNPEPLISTSRTLTASAAAGARTLQLGPVSGLVPSHSGISQLGRDAKNAKWPAAGAIFTALNPSSNTVTLSRPLPVALSSGSQVHIDTMKHLPLYPVGTPQFNDTADAWVNYANVVAKQVSASGITDFDVEIWNELTFGSRFLDINNYYNPPLTKPYKGANFRPGGSAWELARRTAASLHSTYANHVRIIWGFSNTTFEGTPIPDLPTGMEAQSYHPYHDRPAPIASEFNGTGAKAPGDVPADLVVGLAESIFATNIKPESIVARLLPPWIRDTVHPPEEATFYHYITEQGLAPQQSGVTDAALAEMLKTRMLLRNYAFWLNKGITKLEIYAVWDKTDVGFGMLEDNIPLSAYASQPLDSVLSPQLRSLRNYVAGFAGATPATQPRNLDVSVAAVGPQVAVDPGASKPLWYRDLFAFLPFQVSDHKFVCPVYVMTYNLMQALPGGVMGFRVQVQHVDGHRAKVSLYDPIANQTVPAPVLARDATSVTVGVSAVDFPRLLTVDDS